LKRRIQIQAVLVKGVGILFAARFSADGDFSPGEWAHMILGMVSSYISFYSFMKSPLIFMLQDYHAQREPLTSRIRHYDTDNYDLDGKMM
jgi:hypothetical protein